MSRIVAITALLLSMLAPQPAAALENEDLLALVAMPLAVAAVSEITDVPVNHLIDVVSLLNDANVPPVQFVEVVRYVPVALVEEREAPLFVSWLRSGYDSGLRELALVNSIEDRYRTYDLRDLDFDRPQPRIIEVVESPSFVPQIVRTRITERSSHPHGGPPGQLKKELGLQTGAEVVHGTSARERRSDAPVRVIDRDRDDDDRKPNRQAKVDRNDRDERRGSANRGNEVRRSDSRNDEKVRGGGRGKGNDAARGNGGGNKGGGKGNGKGKGKN